MIEAWRGTVSPDQIDLMGHMNVRWYAAKFDAATWALFAAIGITPDYVRDERKGLAALEQHIIYKAEVMEGARLIVRSEVTSISEKIICFRHVLLDAESGREMATCDFTGVHFDLERRKSCPLPDAIHVKASALFSLRDPMGGS